MWDIVSPECHSARGYSIILLYAFHTQRRIKSKFPNHSKDMYLSDIYELIIPPMLLAGRWVCNLTVVLLWGGELETADPHACIDRRAFPANIVHSRNAGLMLRKRRRSRWSSIHSIVIRLVTRAAL